MSTMAYAHYPGCEGGHTRRQRCTTAPVVTRETLPPPRAPLQRPTTASPWIVTLNTCLIVSLLWTIAWFVVLLNIDPACGEQCDERVGAMLLWFLGQFVLAQTALVAFGAVVSNKDHRRFRNVWMGAAAFVVHAALIAIIRAT